MRRSWGRRSQDNAKDKKEYYKGHMEGTKHIFYNDVHGLAKYELKDKDARILLYCGSGKRGTQAMKSLLSLGYTRVYAWKTGTFK